MASALEAPEGGLILEDLVEGIRDGEREHGRGEVLLADGRCVPRSRYLLRSVAEERVVRAKTCTYYLLRGELCVKCAWSTSCRVSFILSSILTVVSPSTLLPRHLRLTVSLAFSVYLGLYLFVCSRLLYATRCAAGPSFAFLPFSLSPAVSNRAWF